MHQPPGFLDTTAPCGHMENSRRIATGKFVMFTDACSTWIKSIYIIQYSHLFAFFASFGDIVVHEYQEFRALGLLSSPTCRYRIPPRPSLQPPTVNEGTQAVTTWPNARYLDGHTTLNHPSRGWLGLLHIYIYIVYYTYIYILSIFTVIMLHE